MLQGAGGKFEPLNIYPSVEDIFAELTRQSNTKLDIPPVAKKVDQPIVEPLTNQEKEEEYEVRLHISTFTLNDSLIEELSTLKIAIVPPTQQQDEEAVQTNEETQSDNLLPKYTMTK